MSTSENYVSGADLSSSQFLPVYVDGAAAEVVKLLVANTGATSTAGVGFLENAPASGEVAEVTFEGIGFGIAGGVVENGDELMVDGSTGKLIVATTGKVVVAKAMFGTSGGAYPADAANGVRIRIYIYANKTRLLA